MKFIGQFIQDFIARFRNDVYLEQLTESAQDHVVGVDADGKLYKQDVSTGDITGVDITVGTGLDISQSNTTSGNYASTINLDLTEVGVNGSANQLLTDDGDGTVTSESKAIIDTVGGVSQLLKNLGTGTVTTGQASTSSFSAYRDVIFYSPNSGGTKINKGAQVNITKAVDSGISSGGIVQSAGDFVSVDLGTNSGSAEVHQAALVANVVGNQLGGTTTGVGLSVGVANSDVNNGVQITTTDTTNGHDIKIASSADQADFFGIKTVASGNTEIETIDSDGANAAHLKLDIDGDITLDSVTGNIVGQTNGGTYTPTADPHLATKKYVDDNTSVSIRSFIDLRKDDLYIQFMSQPDRWYGTGRAGSSIAVASTLDGISVSHTITISNGAFTATRNCTLHSVQITFVPTQTHDYEFEILKVPYVDDSTAAVTLTKMTHTNHNANYTANRTYTKHFDITGGNTLTVGQGIIFALRRTSSGNTPFINGLLIGEIQIT
tara:strand:- start:790 stop:2265 length:1476 start_codon:yes stop_codon:yes gene_type:complete